MNNIDDEKYIQLLEEDILKDSKAIKVIFDDKNTTVNFDLQDNVKKKIDDSIVEDDLDVNSIVKAPSSGKFYVKSISKEDSQSYYGVDDIVKINSLKDIVSESKSNNLIIDKTNKLYASSVSYKQILTESHGKFAQADNSWNFSYNFTNNKTYIIFVDSAEFQNFIRPLQIIVYTAQWKIPLWEGNIPIANTNGEFKGIVRYKFDLTSKTITLSGGFLDKNNSIYIYESVSNTFNV